ncbi:unannotated protein [freshwater metagenome]|uniref:Unannotated protein n=1 Tax=freshwater metagenome TaxID=449393 RepID=A0A6J6TTX4_9ZZZZ
MPASSDLNKLHLLTRSLNNLLIAQIDRGLQRRVQGQQDLQLLLGAPANRAEQVSIPFTRSI